MNFIQDVYIKVKETNGICADLYENARIITFYSFRLIRNCFYIVKGEENNYSLQF